MPRRKSHLVRNACGDKIGAVVREWVQHGHDPHPRWADGRMPKHPEFVYRLSGEWKGWDYFLLGPDAEPNPKHRARDELEDEAWRVYRACRGLLRARTAPVARPTKPAPPTPASSDM